MAAGDIGDSSAVSVTDAARVPLRDEAAVIEAAWLYYHDGLNQTAIADRMQISRASVVNYLSHARMQNWVRLYLDSDVFLGHRLAGKLCERFGLKKALVVADDPSDNRGTTARVTRAAADWLPRLLEPGDRLGVSWGETVYQMVQQVAHQPLHNLTVIQLLGSRPAAIGFAAEACTTLLSQKLGGLCVNLHAPLVLSQKSLRDALCNEPDVATQLDALGSCNKTVLACGTCNEDAHIVRAGLLTGDSIKSYRKAGAIGVICGRLIDVDGNAVPAEFEDRMIGVSLNEMRGKEMSLLIAAGIDRIAPTRAAITGGYATHLATSAEVAKALLEAP